MVSGLYLIVRVISIRHLFLIIQNLIIQQLISVNFIVHNFFEFLILSKKRRRSLNIGLSKSLSLLVLLPSVLPNFLKDPLHTYAFKSFPRSIIILFNCLYPQKKSTIISHHGRKWKQYITEYVTILQWLL